MSRPSNVSTFLGFIISCLLAWLAGAFFCNSVPPLVFDAVLGEYVYASGTNLHYLTEGMGSTQIGEHGLTGEGPKLRLHEPLVVFWGDSFVQGLQVDDEDKMDAQFNRMARETGDSHRAIGIGRFADSVPDYFFRIQTYSAVLSSAALHVIVLGTITDTMPEQQAPCRSCLQPDNGGFKLVNLSCPPKDATLTLRKILFYGRLQFLGEIYERVSSGGFWPLGKPQEATAPPKDAQESLKIPAKEFDAAWQYLIEQMKAVTGSRLVFLYAPSGFPRVKNPAKGGPVNLLNPESAHVARFAELCRRQEVPFHNLSSDLERFYRASGTFPCGFPNSPPSQGHFNAEGHALIAKAMFRYLNDKRPSPGNTP